MLFGFVILGADRVLVAPGVEVDPCRVRVSADQLAEAKATNLPFDPKISITPGDTDKPNSMEGHPTGLVT
jgi:hypothetical protein